MKKISLLFVFCSACNSGFVPPAPASDPSPTIETVGATSAQCPNGGSDIVITSGGVVKNVLVCDGANGATGAQGQTGAQGIEGATGAQGQAASLPVFTETDAGEDQCPTGGVDLTVSSGDSSKVLVICNGDTGATGQTGAQGIQGATGATGATGAAGLGIVFTEVQATTQECPTGGYVLVVATDTQGNGEYCLTDRNQQSMIVCNGATGAKGSTGAQGATGATGATGAAGATGATGQTGATGATGQTGATGAAGKNGTNGTNGTNATQTPFTIVNVITPCGAASSSEKELLLCLADGNILADFSKDDAGDLTRLSFIPPGSYQDTDNSYCNFSVCSDGSGGLTVSWAAQNGWAAGSSTCANTTSK
jgi:hypothetical protein